MSNSTFCGELRGRSKVVTIEIPAMAFYCHSKISDLNRLTADREVFCHGTSMAKFLAGPKMNYRAKSMRLFGEQDYHTFVRFQVACGMIENPANYDSNSPDLS